VEMSGGDKCTRLHHCKINYSCKKFYNADAKRVWRKMNGWKRRESLKVMVCVCVWKRERAIDWRKWHSNDEKVGEKERQGNGKEIVKKGSEMEKK
jgi:hypothetical protein